MLDNEFDYFIENKDVLFEKYPNKYIVIQNCEVKYSTDTFEDAITYGNKTFGMGNFLIQFCGNSSDCYTQIFHTSAIFV